MSTMEILCLLLVADSASQRRLGIAFKACLRYIHMERLDPVLHLESTVTGTLLVDNARTQFLSFFTRYCIFVILLICFLCFILPHRRALGI
jgi:hypothetical protein